MMSAQHELKFGFFSDFRDPTLLFFGNSAALLVLQAALQTLSQSRRVVLEQTTNFQPVGGEKVTLMLTSDHEGIKFVGNPNRKDFEWRLSTSSATILSKRLRNLVQSDRPSHEYLDLDDGDDVMVVASKDEYPDSFRP